MNEWISIKDKLPQENEKVLAYIDDIKEMEVCRYTCKTFIAYIMWECKSVTHWMPLPEVPKGQTELNSKYTRTDASESLDNLGEDDNESEEEEYE